MGMSSASNKGLTNEPNMTPMIDVLLVLLIIFMIIVPNSRKAIDVQLPDPTPATAPANAVSNQIVLEVKPGGQYAINSEVVTRDRLPTRLKEIYDPRPEKIIFVKGDPKVKYADIIDAMDVARGLHFERPALRWTFGVRRPPARRATAAFRDARSGLARHTVRARRLLRRTDADGGLAHVRRPCEHACGRGLGQPGLPHRRQTPR